MIILIAFPLIKGIIYLAIRLSMLKVKQETQISVLFGTYHVYV